MELELFNADDFLIELYLFYYIFDDSLEIEIVDRVAPIAVMEAWLWVSSDFSPKHYDVILILTVESLTGHFSNGKSSSISTILLFNIFDKST